jgi:hypothetical protein
MPTLHLLRFKTLPILPKRTGHWALFLPDEEGGSNGVVYSVQKRSLKSKKTQFSHREFNLQSSIGLLESWIPLPEIDILPYKLSAACHDATKNRPFHLIKNNCQHWVCEVIENLISRFQIAEGTDVLHKIKSLGYSPFLEGFSKRGTKDKRKTGSAPIVQSTT